MKREEALKIIKNGRIVAEQIRANDEETTKYNLENIEALNTAVEALEQEPTDDATLKDIFCMGCEYKEQEPCREADDYENEISDLHNRLDIVEYDKERLREEVTTLEEKLKGLSAEPCGDAISRQAAIDAMCALCNTGETLKENPWRDNPHIDAIIDALDNLPSVTPQPKTGVLEQKTCVTMRNLSDKELKHFVEEMKKVRPQVIRQEPCEDAISRAEVIDELNRIGRNAFKEDTDYDNFFAFLDNLPPVTPKPKTGHWYIDERPESDRETICSNCEQPIFKYHKLDFDYRPKYCPNCGVKMIEPQESEG